MSRFKLQGTSLWLVISAVFIAVVAAPIAMGAGEGKSLLGGARNPGNNSSQEYSKETQIIANNSSYGTRQSNKSSNGGGAIYGCRSGAGGTPANNEPCLRATNLSSGLAFEYETDKGALGGTINVGAGGAGAKPFTTNATGVATGLNADQVDGKDVSTLAPFAKVTAGGALTGSRGAITGVSGGAGNYAVNFSGDISSCAFNTTVSQAGGGIASFSVSGNTVNVETFAVGGASAARAFDLTGSC